MTGPADSRQSGAYDYYIHVLHSRDVTSDMWQCQPGFQIASALEHLNHMLCLSPCEILQIGNERSYTQPMNWKENIITHSAEIGNLLSETRTIAVLGIKTESQASQPAFYVPNYLKNAGFQIIPVPVYYPEVTQILGEHVYRRLADIPVDVDLVNVFRRSEEVPPHVEDILAKKPKAVWMQSGIRNDAAAETLAKAGIKVVQDRCLMVDHRWLKRS